MGAFEVKRNQQYTSVHAYTCMSVHAIRVVVKKTLTFPHPSVWFAQSATAVSFRSGYGTCCKRIAAFVSCLPAMQ